MFFADRLLKQFSLLASDTKTVDGMVFEDSVDIFAISPTSLLEMDSFMKFPLVNVVLNVSPGFSALTTLPRDFKVRVFAFTQWRLD